MTTNLCTDCGTPLHSHEIALCSACVEAALETFEAYQEGDTEPNATEYDCGYHTIAGACVFANTDHCEGCPYRVAIGDVQP